MTWGTSARPSGELILQLQRGNRCQHVGYGWQISGPKFTLRPQPRCSPPTFGLNAAAVLESKDN